MPEELVAVGKALPYILEGSIWTITIVIGAMALGFLFGIPFAIGQVYGGRVTRFIVGGYTWFFRGVPLLVLLFLFYFGLFPLVDDNLPKLIAYLFGPSPVLDKLLSTLVLNLSAFTVGMVVLGLVSAAYQSQIFRGAILSIPAGQMKAAKALGMSDFQAITRIILPQALRLAIPGWSNEYSIVLKDSAVIFALGGAAEIMARTHFVASRTYQHLPLYLTAATIYLCLTYFGLKALRVLENRVRIRGYARSGNL